LYTAFNAGSPGSPGWGIPMATDIAFAVGVLALFGSRVHPSLKVFLLSLAVADDIGAILVIAVFYSAGIGWPALGLAALLVGAMLALRRLHVVWLPIYGVIGFFVWFATLESGVHATIAGVVLGLLAPARPLRGADEAPGDIQVPDSDEGVPAAWFRTWRKRSYELVAPCERLEHALHPYSSFLVIPIFALANAGVRLGGDDLTNSLTSSVTLGIVVGLVLGKLIGITLFAYLAQRAGFAEIPAGVTWPELTGVAALGGIGFTVSLFIAGLAFSDAALIDEAKVGILAASVLAAGVGAVLLLQRASRGGDVPVALGEIDAET
ncbi:MAG: Na+/H+ antiporter NhaA, partial [Actinomycetota bacterium]